eukprot:5710476-Karenia_brevis.AAC.1
MFRSSGTWRNYLGYVKTACLIVGADTSVWSVMAHVFRDPSLARARASIDKAGLFVKREPKWIQRSVVEKLMELGERQQELQRYSMLFLTAYAFMLRLPSEALPLTAVT